METTPDKKVTFISFLLILLLMLIPLVLMLAPFFLASIMGIILGMVANPLYKRLLIKTRSPKITSLSITLGILGLVLIPISFFIMVLIRQTTALVYSVSVKELFTFDAIKAILDKVALMNPFPSAIISPSEIQQHLTEYATIVFNALTGSILSLASMLPEIFMQTALALFVTFFFLLDGPKLWLWAKKILPISVNVRLALVDSFKNTAISVVLASFLAAMAQAVVILLGFLILDLPAPFFAATSTFIFAWIPVLGSFPVWIIGSIYLYIQGSMVKMAVLIIIGLLSGIVDNLVRPLVMSGGDSMHPLISILAIFGGISMFGVVGAFVGPILAAIVIALLNTWPTVAREYGIALNETLEDSNMDGSKN